MNKEKHAEQIGFLSNHQPKYECRNKMFETLRDFELIRINFLQFTDAGECVDARCVFVRALRSAIQRYNMRISLCGNDQFSLLKCHFIFSLTSLNARYFVGINVQNIRFNSNTIWFPTRLCNHFQAIIW